MAEDSSSGGPKLPYFHRTLSPEDQALIGDIRPKPVETVTPTNTVVSSSGKSSGSAWNSANTWEEKDCTSFAKEKLAAVFNEKFELPKLNGYTIVLSPVTTFKGDAQVTQIRGTARFMYEFSFDLKFTVVSDSGSKFKGTIAVSDVINDQLDDIELTLTWTTGKAPPNAELSAVRNVVLNGKVLKNALKAKVVQFEVAFRSL